ncbi:MAG TPA: D-glycerate dehydrogenase [Roseomonas sp.]|nr:D-glycerate dehydrogenase [Roseomonas sp.]
MTPAPPRIIVARRLTEAAADRARREFDAVLAEADMNADQAIAAAIAHRAEALLIGSTVKLDAAAIAGLPDHVRLIANSSVGYDHMDAAAAKARGILVTNTPDVLTDCTADLAFMLLLAACRRAHEYDALMRAGWRKPLGLPDMLGVRPSGKTLGIVGMGRIGRAMAQRARGFGMRILYNNRNRLPPELEQGAEFCPDLEAMLPRCEILSLHLPGGPETGILMTAARFALLPRGAVFVNTARGSVVDEEALLDALKSGHLFAAGLDVFRKEPDYDTRFAELPNVFLTPHVASATRETRDAMGMRALDNIAAVAAGRAPIDPV